MISKAQIKYINSFRLKKHRKQNNSFIAEGVKTVSELINSQIKTERIFALPNWIGSNTNILNNFELEAVELDESELKQVSGLKTPNEVLGIFRIPQHSFDNDYFNRSVTLFLDNIGDPGNLGTIIRTADWFGINGIICSENCVDAYNPKTVQASMGSISRIRIHVTNPADFFPNLSNVNIYGADMNGDPIHNLEINGNNLLVIGSESHGISEDTAQYISNNISIPRLGNAESLNAAVATGILCHAFIKYN